MRPVVAGRPTDRGRIERATSKIARRLRRGGRGGMGLEHPLRRGSLLGSRRRGFLVRRFEVRREDRGPGRVPEGRSGCSPASMPQLVREPHFHGRPTVSLGSGGVPVVRSWHGPRSPSPGRLDGAQGVPRRPAKNGPACRGVVPRSLALLTPYARSEKRCRKPVRGQCNAAIPSFFTAASPIKTYLVPGGNTGRLGEFGEGGGQEIHILSRDHETLG